MPSQRFPIGDGGAEPASLLNREHWVQLGAVGSFLVAFILSLFLGGFWVVNTVNTSGQNALAAINAQASIFRAAIAEQQQAQQAEHEQDEHRITVLEGKEAALEVSVSQNQAQATIQFGILGTSVNKLTLVAQGLCDLLPEAKQHKCAE